ncbi:MAG: zinc-ribbon domain-containing protein [Caldiserica bacterium]|nr:zinc-ribbon domain-containing protein [Caldisericota bacterium]
MEPAKFCIECGKPIPPEAKHCPNCGADVAEQNLAAAVDVQQGAPAPATQGSSPQPVGAGPYSPAPASPVQSASYGGPGAAPRSPYASPAPPQAPVAAGYQRARGATAAKRLGGGFIAIIGGIAMLAAQGLFISKQTTPLNLQNLLSVGLGLLCVVSGIVALAVRGWVPVILAALLSAGVFGLCGLKLYETVTWLQAQTPADATAWTLQSGGIIWIGGMMLGMVAFTKAFQSLFSRR